MKIKQYLLDSELQNWRADIGVDDIADVIALLRDENDRLRQMAELLSAETDYMRRSLLPPQWRPAVRLRSIP
ncbi:hypothetical protein FXV83_34690 [Bradyrhizobium hipponense]|uniref:Uncharacterized protein n=1 Tax=Bradyrhizobium hipponense TaxID=2605638 RepID=A0A5S4YDL6_9BRAD|nr:hypothetical protein [Bradyrhizobium hipponense]TYO62052.1 hypothetical protein FXV83_34690 [Bradyrhizobium hipponense]